MTETVKDFEGHCQTNPVASYYSSDNLELLRNFVACFKIEHFMEVSLNSTNNSCGLVEVDLKTPKWVTHWILPSVTLNSV